MSSKTPWTPGPYSVHPYSAIQTRKFAKDGTYEYAAITIGAGDKMLGEVRFATASAGYPCIDNEAEMVATANLWMAAPELVTVLHEGRRAIGDHHAPDDCYATGPMTGDAFRDLVQCPACSFIAMHEALLSRIEGEK
jgi:hypothetical protein